MRHGIACLAAGCVLVLAACAAVPDAGAQFDGTYVGANTVSRGGNRYCGPDNAAASVSVSAGQFSFPFPISGPQPVVVQVRLRADGSFSGGTEYFESEPGMFHGPLAWVTMVGHVDGATLDAQVASLRCSRHLALRRS
jgi:hypothetical protein